MDITQVLVNWKNENETSLDQLKVDNPNLYNAIGGALSFLSKKYGGEDIVLKVSQQAMDMAILKTILKQKRIFGTDSTLDTIYQGMADVLPKNYDLRNTGNNNPNLEDDLELLINRKLVSKYENYDGNKYTLTAIGADVLLDYLNENNQYEAVVSEIEKAQEQLLERNRVQLPTSQTFPIGLKDFDKAILLTIDELSSLPYITLDDIYRAVKVVAFKYFKIITQTSFDEAELGRRLENMAGTYVKKLNYDLYILTSSGQEVVDLLKTQLKTTPKVEEIASLTQTDIDMSILKNIMITRNKLGIDPSAYTIWRDFDGLLPENYDIRDTGKGNPNLRDDLLRLVALNLVGRVEDPNDQDIYRYNVTSEGSKVLQEYLENIGEWENFKDKFFRTLGGSSPEVLEFTPVTTTTTPTTAKTNLRPSPTESATMFALGTTLTGNDGNVWRVTETKNGIKRWTKTGEIPSDVLDDTLPDPTNLDLGTIANGKFGQTFKVALVKGNKKDWIEVDPIQPEPEIPEVVVGDNDEIDFDELENMLDDDSLDFNISDEDLENLEF